MRVPEVTDSTTILVGGVFALSLLWWLSTRRPPGIPPGPGPALPVIGHLYLMRKDPRILFRQWRRQYGDIFSLYFGDRLVVVLNGYPVIREAFVKYADFFSERPHMFISDRVGRQTGMIITSGPLWKEQRKTSLQILREFGMGRNLLAEKIQEEIGYYIQAIEDLEGAEVDLQHLTTVSISNNICSIVFGKRFHYDDPVFTGYLKRVEEFFKCLGGTAAINFIPFLDFLPGDLFHVKKVLADFKFIEDNFLWPQIDSHKEMFSVDYEASDYVYAYLREMTKKEENEKETTLNEKNLLMCTSDLFLAGTETTSTTILWTLLFLLHYPDVQDECFKEISDVLGPFQQPSMDDKPEMTYLEATIMEVLRKSSIAPFAIQHAPPHDITFHGYFIPKDALITPCLDSVLHDPNAWGDPENFRPERFISPDGKLTKPEEFIPFSIGRRSCLGESLARMELFLYISNLIQHFRFVPPEDGTLPSLEGDLGGTHSPKPFKIRALVRELRESTIYA